MTPSDDAVAVEADAPTHALGTRFEPFATALEHKFGMPEEDALATARIVADAFGNAREVDDDALNPEVRSIFYTLESKDLLTFRREEYTSEEGKTLRAYFWRIRDEALRQWTEELAEEGGEAGVYDKLPQDVWDDRNT